MLILKFQLWKNQKNVGEEITLSIKKSGDGVTIAGKVFPLSEWIDFKLTFDTYEKKYKIYVNDVEKDYVSGNGIVNLGVFKEDVNIKIISEEVIDKIAHLMT